MKLALKFLFVIPNFLNFFLLKFNRIDGKVEIRGVITILNRGEIKLGKDCIINSSRFKNIIGGDTRTSIIVQKNAKLVLGNHVKISNSAIQCTKQIKIGNYVMIGGNCKIWDTDFHSLDPEIRRLTPNDGANFSPIIIEDNVFIGSSSIILKGVTIGENSIVAAGSVVSKNIPANEIWGGNPAKLIRKI